MNKVLGTTLIVISIVLLLYFGYLATQKQVGENTLSALGFFVATFIPGLYYLKSKKSEHKLSRVMNIISTTLIWISILLLIIAQILIWDDCRDGCDGWIVFLYIPGIFTYLGGLTFLIFSMISDYFGKKSSTNS